MRGNCTKNHASAFDTRPGERLEGAPTRRGRELVPAVARQRSVKRARENCEGLSASSRNPVKTGMEAIAYVSGPTQKSAIHCGWAADRL